MTLLTTRFLVVVVLSFVQVPWSLMVVVVVVIKNTVQAHKGYCGTPDPTIDEIRLSQQIERDYYGNRTANDMTPEDFSSLFLYSSSVSSSTTKQQQQQQNDARGEFGGSEGFYQLVDVPIVFHVLVNQTLDGKYYPTLTANQMYYAMNYTNKVYTIYDRISDTTYQFVTFKSELVINTKFTKKRRNIEPMQYTKSDFASIITTIPEWQYKIHVIICSQSIAGYAPYPWTYRPNDPRDNIIVIDYTQVSCYYNTGPYDCSTTTDTPTNPLLTSSAIPHELGHLFGLFHTFAGGCYSPYGDGVSDTPAERYRSNLAPCPGLLPFNKSRNLFDTNAKDSINTYTSPDQCLVACGTSKTCASCYNLTCCQSDQPYDSCRFRPGIDPRTNMMTYNANTCANDFTPGQLTRMIALTRQWKRHIYCNYANVKDPTHCKDIPCASTATSPNCI